MLILREILQKHPFLMARNFETQGCQWYRLTQIRSIFADKGNNGTRLQHLFITSSSSHFFNKPDVEQYLFKATTWQ